ncbi:efflux RND transporter permease subunit [Sphingomonas sp. MMS24-JH45]
MVPYTAFSTLEWGLAPVQLDATLGQPAMQIQGAACWVIVAARRSKALEDLRRCHRAPASNTGLPHEEKLSGGQGPTLYGLSLLIVFLCLAALYESWSAPISRCWSCRWASSARWPRRRSRGSTTTSTSRPCSITTMGVARQELDPDRRVRGGVGIAEGMSAFDAAVEERPACACAMIMTSFAFIGGPAAALSTGAGAGGQNAIGLGGGWHADRDDPRELPGAHVLRRGRPPSSAATGRRRNRLLAYCHHDHQRRRLRHRQTPARSRIATFGCSADLLVADVDGLAIAPEYQRPDGAVPAALPDGGVYRRARRPRRHHPRPRWREFFVGAAAGAGDRHRARQQSRPAHRRGQRVAGPCAISRHPRRSVPSTTISGSATYTNNIFGATRGRGGRCRRGARAERTGGTGGGGAGVGAGAGTSSSNIEFYSVNAGFSAFELDLFGRVRNLNRASLEQYFASEEAQRAARISLIAEVATAWATMASDQKQLRLAQETLKTFEETQRLTQAQFRIGVASELEARQAETNYQACVQRHRRSEDACGAGPDALDLAARLSRRSSFPPGSATPPSPATRCRPPPSSEVLLRSGSTCSRRSIS